MMTIKKFWQNPYLTELETTIKTINNNMVKHFLYILLFINNNALLHRQLVH